MILAAFLLTKNLIFLDFDFIFIILEKIDDADVRSNYEPFTWSKSIFSFLFSLIYFFYFRVS